MYILNYSDDIIEKRTKFISLTELNKAKVLLQEMKDAFVEECSFMDYVTVELDTPTHYEATDGEDWIIIQITQTVD